MTISASDFDYVADVTHRRAAIVLDAGKEYLVENRLEPLARRLGFPTHHELIRAAAAGDQGLEAQIVDAMTTNETSFFRDRHPWETLEQHILPQLLKARASSRSLTVWSTACSSGQEPYSLAMLLQERFSEVADSWKVTIHAQDLSPTMVERAKAGIFSQLEVGRGLPASYLVRHFTRSGLAWQVSSKLQEMVSFSEGNLADSRTWPDFPAADLILCRNVLIYFDRDTKAKTLEGLASRLQRDGYLLLGSSEAPLGLTSTLARQVFGNTITYQRTS